MLGVVAQSHKFVARNVWCQSILPTVECFDCEAVTLVRMGIPSLLTHGGDYGCGQVTY
jgi:hypothetical protein